MGGGPGTYAIHFCLKNPDLTATVFDLPTTRPFAEKVIRQFSLTERVQFAPGSYLTDDIPGHYDAAWLSHILHAEGPDVCRMIIQKAVDRLESGGILLVHDFILDNSMDRPLYPALFALNMLLGTDAGQSYSDQQIRDFLADAGLVKIDRLDFVSKNKSGIIVGYKA